MSMATTAEKFAKRLGKRGEKRPGLFSPTWLGEELNKKMGYKSGYGLIYRYARGKLPLTKPVREALEDIMKLSRNALLGDDESAPTTQPIEEQSGSSAAPPMGDYDSLHTFLASDRAKRMNPPPTSREIVQLADHHVGPNDPGEDYFYHHLMAERARLKTPTARPNEATGAARRAGAKPLIKTPASKKAKGHLRVLSDERE